MRRFFFSRRGQVPIIIFVLGVLAVCALLLLTFFRSSSSVNDGFSGLYVARELASQDERYSFYLHSGQNLSLDPALMVESDSDGTFVSVQYQNYFVKHYVSLS